MIPLPLLWIGDMSAYAVVTAAAVVVGTSIAAYLADQRETIRRDVEET